MEKLTIEQAEMKAKEYGVELDLAAALNAAIAEKHQKTLPMRYDATFRLGREHYPEMKKTSFVITDDGNENIMVGVKVMGRVFKPNSFECKEELFGDFCYVSKSEPISKFFEVLTEVYAKVKEQIEHANQDVKA